MVPELVNVLIVAAPLLRSPKEVPADIVPELVIVPIAAPVIL